jgi:hypothetical protein
MPLLPTPPKADPPETGPGGLRGWLAAGCLALALACGGGFWPARNQPTGSAPSVGGLAPASPSVQAGGTIQFTTSAPAGTPIAWTVTPPGGGTIASNGLFQASTQLGSYTVTATWNQPGAFSATTPLNILPVAQASTTVPDRSEENGGFQSNAAHTFANDIVIGGGEVATTSTNASGTMVHRSGFYPATPTRPVP